MLYIIIYIIAFKIKGIDNIKILKGELLNMINIEKNIGEMTNRDIKDKILSMNKEQIALIRDASYFIGMKKINTLKEDYKHFKNFDKTILNQEIELLKNYMNKVTNHLEDAITCHYNKEIVTDIKELENIRQELKDLSSIVLGYQIELNYVMTMLDDTGLKILSKRDYANKEYNRDMVDDLIDVITESLENAKGDYVKYNNIISEIITVLPMRLVKANYLTILKNSINRNLKQYSKPEIEFVIEDYKKQFDSSIRDGYGTKFDYYFREIQKLKNINISSISLDELDSITDKTIELADNIKELYYFIIYLGLIMNNIIVVTMLTDIPTNSEIEEIFNEWIDIKENNSEDKIEKFNEKIEKKISKIEKSLFNRLDEFTQLNNEALLRSDFDHEELREELLYTQKVLTIYNDINLVDYNKIFDKSDEPVTDEFIEQVTDSLIQYINRSLTKMGNMERKLRMRKLLSMIDLPFNNMQEFMDFIRYSLDDKVLSKEEIGLKVDYIQYYLEGIERVE